MKFLKSLGILLLLSIGVFGCGNSSDESSGSTEENSYPTDNITITVPYPAGGVNDVLSRQVATLGEEYLGTSVVVENLTGGGGTTAATEYLQEEANTHNIMLGSRSIFVTVPTVQDTQYSFEDFEPIIGIDNVEFILYTNPDQTGIDSVESLIEYGQENTINYGTAGAGTDIDLIQSGLFAMAGANAEAVTFGGGGEAINNVAAGHIDVAAGPPGAGKELVNDGSIVPIAVAGEEPFTDFEGVTVPTLTEEGYDIVYPGLNFFTIKAGTDEENIQFLHDKIAEIYETDEFQETVANMEVDLKPIGPEEIKQYIDEQTAVAEELQSLIDSQ